MRSASAVRFCAISVEAIPKAWSAVTASGACVMCGAQYRWPMAVRASIAAMTTELEYLLAVEIASPLGPLRLRREVPGDDGFRFALFCESRPELAMLPLDAAVKERL